MTFSDLSDFKNAGTYKHDRLDPTLKNMFGYDTKPPEIQDHCLCGHSIKQPCYKCPEGSTNVGDIVIVITIVLTKWGFEAAIRGTGVNIKCEYCEAAVNKSGTNIYHETNRCRQRGEEYTSSTISTSVGSDD